MNILILGGGSFVGGHLIQHFIKKSKNIFIITSNKKNIFKNLTYSKKIKKIFIMDMTKKICLTKFKVDCIIDCGWIGVYGSERNSRIQKKNLLYTKNLVNILKDLRPKIIISFGSQAEYGNIKKIRKESLKVKPVSLYGKIKLQKFFQLAKITKKLNIRFVWLRIFSCFGPNEKYDWLIPYVIKTILNNKKLKITSGSQRIDTVYIEDVVSAVDMVIKKSTASGIYNLAYGKSYKVKDIVKKIRDLVNKKYNLSFGSLKLRKDENLLIKSSTKKLKLLGWKPRFNLNEGLKKTVNYYKKLK